MGNGVSTDQGKPLAHDKRDVSGSADTGQYDWSEQAEAPEKDTLSVCRNSYNGARTWGPSSRKDETYRKKKSSVMKDDKSSSAEDV